LLLSETASKWNVDPGVVIAILADLTSRVGPTLIDGETLDVQFSRQPIEDVPESLVLDMLWKKTGVLYEFSGQTGAAIGRSDATLQDEMVRAIATFCGKCGTAFQLQDDILGIVGDASQLGKPVGSDIREGKRTTIVLKAFQEANATQRATLDQILGNPRATGDDIATATALLRNLGGIDYTRDLARKYVSDAIPHLENVPASMYKDLLMLWAAYLIEREF
jgi:geranylgeranyl diphosphate synthase type I